MRKMTNDKRLSSSDIAYKEIKRRIIEWIFIPEQQLVEEELSTDLEVSRTPLRQALYRLELEGLIIKKPNGRMHVAPISLNEAEEVYKVREVLEGLLAREATEQMSEEVLQQLEDILHLMKLAADQGRNEHTVKYGSEFHALLYALSANETAKRFLLQVDSLIERYRRLGGYKNPAYVPAIPVQEHEAILELIRSGDGVGVENEMREHIKRNLEVTKDTLKLYLHDEQ
ncbi:GntR family transcriptional regulator [Sporosarcina koreensis]|uniref:GntR family transcriptional regulator n=1 Tax=Sporosarcina koreensis TaxID=334735 RepID=A0ABW0U2J3_9BACL